MDLLENPVERLIAISIGRTLDADVSRLAEQYTARGVRGDLTGQEVLDGLADCNEALNILNDPDAEIEVSPSYLQLLSQTIQGIEGDLSHEL